MKILRLLAVTAILLATASSGQAFLGFFSQHETVTAENGRVTIPVSRIGDGKAHYFSFRDQGADLKFFVLKSSDNVIRAAFDACDVCYGDKKGYSQDKEFMVCNNCGMRFHSSRINEVEGGCNPSPLTRSVENGEVVINVSDLSAGARYFR